MTEKHSTAATRMNVESFNLDHRLVKAPYIRVADIKTLPGGDVIKKYDVRFRQPNREHIPMDTVHALEHTMAEKIRNHAHNVIDVSPMGCQTGFYVTVFNQDDDGAFFETLERTLTDVAEATEVPAANEIQCGWGANHDLEGAHREARRMLENRGAWHEVGI